MTRFIGVDGLKLNLDQIRKVEFLVNGDVKLTYQNGDEERLNPRDWHADAHKRFVDDLKETTWEPRPKVIIPANPGFDIVGFWIPSYGDPETYDIAGNLWRTPVIAWKIDAGFENWGIDQTAIGVDINTDEDQEYGWIAVLKPNGEVRSTVGCQTLEEWIKTIREQWPEIAEKRKKAEEELKRKRLQVVKEPAS